jgi:hypothetical protein
MQPSIQEETATKESIPRFNEMWVSKVLSYAAQAVFSSLVSFFLTDFVANSKFAGKLCVESCELICPRFHLTG